MTGHCQAGNNHWRGGVARPNIRDGHYTTNFEGGALVLKGGMSDVGDRGCVRPSQHLNMDHHE